MPTVLDATVVNSAYDTSGNGGRRIVRLNDGSLVNVLTNGTTDYKVYKSTDGSTWNLIQTISGVSGAGTVSIATNGTHVFILCKVASADLRGYSLDSNGNIIGTFTSVDSGQSALGNVSLAINEAGTELHAAWASKNSTYPNSYNIRYCKGTINGDGSVTWGAVEQWTTNNTTGQDYKNPSVIVKADGKPVIIYDYFYNGNSSIIQARYWNGTTYKGVDIYSVSATYPQSYPSAIFVPQSVNGLANGKIKVEWVHAKSGDSNLIGYSESTDGGVTWTTNDPLTGIVAFAPTSTEDKSGNHYVLYHDNLNNIYKAKKLATGWGAPVLVKGGGGNSYPSALYDPSFTFTEPLFIYRGASKVGFYGTWTVTTISVTPGDLGQKTDKANLLTYSITTDGTMSAITEKVNGVIVGTKTAASGQSLTVGLTQEQWDAIRFGRYADATGGKNTLTIEMGTEKWTYTFDKRPATDADIISAAKAHKDIAEVVDPARKALMASAIRSKGGSASDADAWETMAQAVGGIPLGKKWASGTATGSAQTLEIRGLDFSPNFVFVKAPTNVGSFNQGYGAYTSEGSIMKHNAVMSGLNGTTMGQYSITSYNDGFKVTTAIGGTAQLLWIAFE